MIWINAARCPMRQCRAMMTETPAATCRRFAAHYQELAAQPALPHFRDGFARLAASYAALAEKIEVAENAVPSDHKGDCAP
jgi:hypothetical protein